MRGCSSGLPMRPSPPLHLQGGDITAGDGTGGASIYAGTPDADAFGAFRDERFDHASHVPFVLSMANSGRNRNRSQFFFTLARMPHLDGKHVVFGRVLDGFGALLVAAAVPIAKGSSDKPSLVIRVADCRQLLPGDAGYVDDASDAAIDARLASARALVAPPAAAVGASGRVSAASSQPEQPPLTAAETERLTAAVTAFYAAREPSKAGNAPALVTRYGRGVWAKIEDKYGAGCTAEFQEGGGAESAGAAAAPAPAVAGSSTTPAAPAPAPAEAKPLEAGVAAPPAPAPAAAAEPVPAAPAAPAPPSFGGGGLFFGIPLQGSSSGVGGGKAAAGGPAPAAGAPPQLSFADLARVGLPKLDAQAAPPAAAPAPPKDVAPAAAAAPSPFMSLSSSLIPRLGAEGASTMAFGTSTFGAAPAFGTAPPSPFAAPAFPASLNFGGGGGFTFGSSSAPLPRFDALATQGVSAIASAAPADLTAALASAAPASSSSAVPGQASVPATEVSLLPPPQPAHASNSVSASPSTASSSASPPLARFRFVASPPLARHRFVATQPIGIKLEAAVSPASCVRVSSVATGSQAALAGISSGDELVEIAGVSLAGLAPVAVLGRLKSAFAAAPSLECAFCKANTAHTAKTLTVTITRTPLGLFLRNGAGGSFVVEAVSVDSELHAAGITAGDCLISCAHESLLTDAMLVGQGVVQARGVLSGIVKSGVNASHPLVLTFSRSSGAVAAAAARATLAAAFEPHSAPSAATAGPAKTITVSITRTPLGLSLRDGPGGGSVVVEAVSVGSESHAAGVAAGDCLVACAHESLPTGAKLAGQGVVQARGILSGAIKAGVNSSHPLVLQFKRGGSAVAAGTSAIAPVAASTPVHTSAAAPIVAAATGPAKTITVSVTRTPLGLSLRDGPGGGSVVVDAVSSGSESRAAGIAAGDCLVACAHDSLPTGAKLAGQGVVQARGILSGAIKAGVNASHPLVLQFKRGGVAASASGAPAATPAAASDDANDDDSDDSGSIITEDSEDERDAAGASGASAAADAHPADFSDLASRFAVAEGSWKCGVCLVTNKPGRERCVACETANPAAAPAASPAPMATSASTPFIFGAVPSSLPVTSAPAPAFQFSFGAPASAAPLVPSSAPTQVFNFGLPAVGPTSAGAGAAPFDFASLGRTPAPAPAPATSVAVAPNPSPSLFNFSFGLSTTPAVPSTSAPVCERLAASSQSPFPAVVNFGAGGGFTFGAATTALPRFDAPQLVMNSAAAAATSSSDPAKNGAPRDSSIAPSASALLSSPVQLPTIPEHVLAFSVTSAPLGLSLSDAGSGASIRVHVDAVTPTGGVARALEVLYPGSAAADILPRGSGLVRVGSVGVSALSLVEVRGLISAASAKLRASGTLQLEFHVARRSIVASNSSQSPHEISEPPTSSLMAPPLVRLHFVATQPIGIKLAAATSPASCVSVSAVVPGSQADIAGVAAGDELVEIAGESLAGLAPVAVLGRLKSALAVGPSLECTFRKARPIAAAAAPASSAAQQTLAVSVTRTPLGLSLRDGAGGSIVVEAVTAGSESHAAGIAAGDCLISCSHESLPTCAKLADQGVVQARGVLSGVINAGVNTSRPLVLQFKRGGSAVPTSTSALAPVAAPAPLLAPTTAPILAAATGPAKTITVSITRTPLGLSLRDGPGGSVVVEAATAGSESHAAGVTAGDCLVACAHESLPTGAKLAGQGVVQARGVLSGAIKAGVDALHPLVLQFKRGGSAVAAGTSASTPVAASTPVHTSAAAPNVAATTGPAKTITVSITHTPLGLSLRDGPGGSVVVEAASAATPAAASDDANDDDSDDSGSIITEDSEDERDAAGASGASAAADARPADFSDLASRFAVAEGSWKCGVCLVTNKPGRERCVACETPNPAAAPAASPVPTATSASAPFIFGAAPSSLPVTSAPAPAFQFSFGAAPAASGVPVPAPAGAPVANPAAFQFNFGAPPASVTAAPLVQQPAPTQSFNFGLPTVGGAAIGPAAAPFDFASLGRTPAALPSPAAPLTAHPAAASPAPTVFSFGLPTPAAPAATPAPFSQSFNFGLAAPAPSSGATAPFDFASLGRAATVPAPAPAPAPPSAPALPGMARVKSFANDAPAAPAAAAPPAPPLPREPLPPPRPLEPAVAHPDSLELPPAGGASLVRVRFPRLPLGLTLRPAPLLPAPGMPSPASSSPTALPAVERVAEVSPAAGGVLLPGDVLVGLKQPGLALGRLVDLRWVAGHGPSASPMGTPPTLPSSSSSPAGSEDRTSRPLAPSLRCCARCRPASAAAAPVGAAAVRVICAP